MKGREGRMLMIGIALLVVLGAISMARGQDSTLTPLQVPHVSTGICDAWWVFLITVGAIVLIWTVTIITFAKKNKLELLVDLTRGGQTLKLTTVLYIVVLMFTLGLFKLMDSHQIATLLASIAGYVLGESAAVLGAKEASKEQTATIVAMKKDTPQGPEPPPQA